MFREKQLFANARTRHTGETASTANDFAAASIMPAKRLRILLAEVSSPVDHAMRIARRRVDRQHKIFSRSYRDQRWWVQRTRSSAISSDHLVPYQDDEQRIWRCCSSTCARPGVPRILRVWRFPHSPHSRRFSGNLQSLRLIITIWRVKPRRRERIGTH